MNSSYGILILSVFIAAVSQILLKKSALKKYTSVIWEYLNPYVIVGYGLMFGSTILTIIQQCTGHRMSGIYFCDDYEPHVSWGKGDKEKNYWKWIDYFGNSCVLYVGSGGKNEISKENNTDKNFNRSISLMSCGNMFSDF